jgi:hypothetical protein
MDHQVPREQLVHQVEVDRLEALARLDHQDPREILDHLGV